MLQAGGHARHRKWGLTRLGQGWVRGGTAHAGCFPNNVETERGPPPTRGARCTWGRQSGLRQPWAAGGTESPWDQGKHAAWHLGICTSLTQPKLPSASVCNVNTQLPARGCPVLPALPRCQGRVVGGPLGFLGPPGPTGGWMKLEHELQRGRLSGTNDR